LIPIGATEQHGTHTPLMVDTAWAIAAAEGAGRRAGVLAAPPMHFGWSPHHLAFPGAITLRPETLTQVIIDVCQSLMVHGFKKFVLVNGNRVANLAPMEIAAAKLRYRHEAFAAVVDVGLIARREVHEICGGEAGALGHAGDSETSFMLHYLPHLVEMSNAVSGVAAGGGNPRMFAEHWISMEPPHDQNAVLLRPSLEEYRQASEPSGTGGNPMAASAEKGARILDAIVTNTVAFIDEVRDRPVTLKDVEFPI
jgi:creatinine amidohydrolase